MLFTELLLAGRVEWLLSEYVFDSREALVAEADLAAELVLGAAARG